MGGKWKPNEEKTRLELISQFNQSCEKWGNCLALS